MARTSTYLNFPGNTEEAFNFYRQVFGTDFVGKINRFSDNPKESTKPLNDEDKNLIMHVALPILGGHVLMGTDAPESMGFKVVAGNNVYIMLEPDSKSEADRLYAALSEGGVVEMSMKDMFWGDYYGSFKDKFGVQWMLNVAKK